MEQKWLIVERRIPVASGGEITGGPDLDACFAAGDRRGRWPTGTGDGCLSRRTGPGALVRYACVGFTSRARVMLPGGEHVRIQRAIDPSLEMTVLKTLSAPGRYS